MTSSEEVAADATLLARLRRLWERIDPAPAELVDRMVAAVAVEDLTREYELLALVEGAELGAVRSTAGTATLQFSDGTTNVLLHVSVTEGGKRRLDGWVDGSVLAIRLAQQDQEWATDPGDQGRFAFDSVPPGLCRLRLVVRDNDGRSRDFHTPQFEL